MRGEAAKDRGKKVGAGDAAIGWLDALEPGKNLVVDAPWELQLAKEMGTAAGKQDATTNANHDDTL